MKIVIFIAMICVYAADLQIVYYHCKVRLNTNTDANNDKQ